MPDGPGLGVTLDRDKLAEYAELYEQLGNYPYDRDPGTTRLVRARPQRALGPAMIETLYVANHTHTDIGFTDHQDVCFRQHAEFITQAMDVIEATADYPEEARFRWTCEVTGTAGALLRERLRRPGRALPPPQRERHASTSRRCSTTSRRCSASSRWSAASPRCGGCASATA